MSKFEVSDGIEVEFELEKVYRIFADYNEGHCAILPRTYFQKLTVEQGGRCNYVWAGCEPAQSGQGIG